MAYATLWKPFIGETTQEPSTSRHDVPRRLAVPDSGTTPFYTAHTTLPQGVSVSRH
jgi:hypothetical protein